jgi:hypothetical protein
MQIETRKLLNEVPETLNKKCKLTKVHKKIIFFFLILPYSEIEIFFFFHIFTNRNETNLNTFTKHFFQRSDFIIKKKKKF